MASSVKAETVNSLVQPKLHHPFEFSAHFWIVVVKVWHGAAELSCIKIALVRFILIPKLVPHCACVCVVAAVACLYPAVPGMMGVIRIS